MENNKPITISFEDGSTKSIIFSSINVSSNGIVTLQGKLYDSPCENTPCDKIEEPVTVLEKKQYIRSYLFKSALIRFLYKDELRTAVITHATDKAFRIYNKDLGATWIPKNIVRWSEIAQQFCVVDEYYVFDFTDNISNKMKEYPSIFNPESLINELI